MRNLERPRDDVLNDEFAAGPEELREIEQVVSLLRSLPDPEPETDLAALVMRRVREIEQRPRVLRGAFAGVLEPRVVSALAAGVACVALALGWGIGSDPAQNRVDTASLPDPVGLPRVVVPYGGSPRGFAIASALPDPRTVMFAGVPAEPVLPVAAGPVPLDRGLDMQLNELQLDPQAFFQRLERMRQRDRFLERLADRAARRGDAVQVALQLRAVPHPLATPMVDQFLHASLVRQVGGP